jgi:hypothetical protein
MNPLTKLLMRGKQPVAMPSGPPQPYPPVQSYGIPSTQGFPPQQVPPKRTGFIGSFKAGDWHYRSEMMWSLFGKLAYLSIILMALQISFMIVVWYFLILILGSFFALTSIIMWFRKR